MRDCPFVPGGLLMLLVACLCLFTPLTAAHAQEKSAAATRQYNTAVGLHNSEAYDLAAGEWWKFLEGFGNDPRIDLATHYLGVCRSKQGQWDEAIGSFQTVVAKFPKSKILEDAYLNLGLTQYNLALAGKPEVYDAAGKTFAALAAKFPKGKYRAEALYYEGECLCNRGQKAAAVAKYAEVVQKHADSLVASQALFALGVAQAELGQHEAALASYDRFLERYPQDPTVAETRMWQGESLYALKQYGKADKAYAAAAAERGFAMADYALVRRADTLTALGKFAEAAALYASVPTKFPKSEYAGLCNLEAGKKYYAAGDTARAVTCLAKVVAVGGKQAPEAAHWQARCLLKEKKPTEALALVEKALAADAGRETALLLMDQADAVYEIPQRRREAIALYAQLAAKRPTDPSAPQALYMAAFTAMELGDYAAALKHAGTFIASHADSDLAIGTLHVMAESNLLLKRPVEAEKLYTELLEKAPNDQDAEIWRVHRGTALSLQKKHAEAIAALEAVVAKIKAPDLKAEARFRIGRSQVALKQYAAAMQSLKASLAAAPQWKLADDTHLVLAYACQQTGDFAGARENAQRVITDFPNSKLLDIAHYRLAEGLRLGGDLTPAIAAYQQVIAKWSTSSLLCRTLFGLGWAQLGQEAFAEAAKTFTVMIEKFPKETLIPRARYGRGMARRQLKQYAEAADDINALLAADPTPAERTRARHILGLCQKGLAKNGEAIATFKGLLADDADYADADSVYFELGWAQKAAGKADDAAATFALLAEKYPESKLAADSLYMVGDFADKRQEYKNAAKGYYVAMKKAGKTSLGEESAYRLGLAYFNLGDVKNAHQTFRYQRATWPEGALIAEVRFMLAECLFQQKQYDKALAGYEAAGYKMTGKASNQKMVALALLHSSEAAGHLSQWKKSLALATDGASRFADSPDLPKFLYLEGRAQQNLDKPNEAMKLYSQVIDKTDDEWAARAQFMIGEIQFGQKKHDDAIKSFYKVIYAYGYPTWQADATYEAARCFETRGEKSKALRLYETLVEKYPKSDKVALARGRIAKLSGAGS